MRARGPWTPTTVRLVAILIGTLVCAIGVVVIVAGVSALALHLSRDDAGFASSPIVAVAMD